MIEKTTTVTVRHWGPCQPDGHAPYRLAEFLLAADDAFKLVPDDYKDSAMIDFDPEHSHGETYEQVRITYEQPMTPEEIAEDKAENRDRLEHNIATYGTEVDRWKAELAALDAT